MAKSAIVHAQQRWEYVSLNRRTESYLAAELNKLGESGWELVSVIRGKDATGETFWSGFLKRPAAQRSGQAATQEEVARSQSEPSQAQAKADPSGALSGFDLSGEEFDIQQ